MPQFILDYGTPEAARDYSALDAFTRGYIEAMFFTECHSDNPELEHATVADLAPETMTKIMADCHRFQTSEAGEVLLRIYESDQPYTPEQAGRDFWFDRNGHGVGFWDRGLGAAGDKLSDYSYEWSAIDLYRGDDERLYLM
jgi:hypothetical protein